MSIEQKRLPSGQNLEPYHYLFQDCFPETAGTSLETPEHYRWKYSAAGKQAPPFEYAACADGRIQGYYAALPLAYQVGGTSLIAGLVCDVMTHSQARGKGIFTAQGRFATADMAANGIAFCTGYPIRSYVFPGHLKVGWRIAFPLPVYARLLDVRPVLASRRLPLLGKLLQPLCAAWRQASRLTGASSGDTFCREQNPETFFASDEFRSFYTTWARYSPCHLVRTEDFYRWRLGAPQSAYQVTALYAKSKLAGVAITRNSMLSGFPITNILDLMLLPEHRKAAGALHDAIAQVSRQARTAGVVVMCTRSDAARFGLLRNGYFRTNIQFKLIMKWLAAAPEPAAFWDESAWHLTWLDTDNL